ncbi:MAG: asparagine synthase (glutamine-hydrolyzing), partial [Candidatus Acidiferrum sp.]
MCGIAGILAIEGFDPARLVSMTHLVKHRGPDGYGFVYFDLHSESPAECFHNHGTYPTMDKPSLGFGARRLAILDLSPQGDQPMQIENGDLWITYNGEVYNYIEIRRELERVGRSFKSHTDTEVILSAYSEWGTACVNRFNGMWSFAIWDRRTRKLFCSRDRFGVKPFYYFTAPSLLLFGSEIKQVLNYPGVHRTVNQTIASQYLQYGVQDHTDSTFFAGIHQLPGGHSLIVDLTQPTLSLKIEKYWELPIEKEEFISQEEATQKFSTLLGRGVTLRMRSDVPVGSCLSGGLDSSSVVAVATNAAESKDFHTFSSCFEEASIDERQYIREVVASTAVTPHFVFPRAEGFWDDLNCLVWHQDEPVGGTSVYAQWCVMRAARQARIPVLLDGQGGDETLCGYRKFYVFYLWHLLKHSDPLVLKEGLAWIRNASQIAWSWSSAKRYIPSFYWNNEPLLSRVGNLEFTLKNHASSKVNLGPGVDLRRRQKEDLTYFSIPALLHYEDRNSMAHSIEARVPMLDYELATFAVNCRPSLKLRDGWTKWILRQAMKGSLPEEVRLRKSKLGFATPQKEWLRQDARGTLRFLIHEPDLKMRQILCAKKLQSEGEQFFHAKPGCLTEVEI